MTLVSYGRKNREIAESMFLSKDTVQWYMNRMYWLTDTHTRPHLVATAIRAGWL